MAKGSLGAFNQVNWAGVFDADECWIIATYWALVATGILLKSELPSITDFRKAAGRPDDPNRADGGSNANIVKALQKLVPAANLKAFNGGLADFTKMLSQGYVASLAVNSRYLPKYLQFGFTGTHQISVIYQGGQFYVMNPLMQDGAALLSITATALEAAAGKFIGKHKRTGVLGDRLFHAVLIKAKAAAVAKALAPIQHQPRSLQHLLARPEYITPYGARDFYEKRPHLGDHVLGEDGTAKTH